MLKYFLSGCFARVSGRKKIRREPMLVNSTDRGTAKHLARLKNRQRNTPFGVVALHCPSACKKFAVFYRRRTLSYTLNIFCLFATQYFKIQKGLIFNLVA